MIFRWDDYEPFAQGLAGLGAFGPIDDFRRRFERVFEDLDREWRPQPAA